jgi:tetratricopeptide (TPR) repeat protein
MKPEALLGIAACRHAQGKPGEAIPYYQRIYVMYQAYTNAVATAYLRSGEAFEQLNDREAAIRTYREMLGIGTVARTPEAQKAREHLARLGS